VKEPKKSNQDLDISQAELDRYESLDREWREYGLSAPARRALVDAKLYKVSDLRKISQSDLEDLHGMGKSAIARLKVLMNAKKIKFLP
jgi:DNA-directed RNA polymerase alpha subunit